VKAVAVKLKTLADAGVPDSVSEVLKAHGHLAILHREVLLDKTPDEVVCATALANEAILIAIDGDMKQMAKKYGVTPSGERFDKLDIIRLCCPEPMAAKRLEQALPLIEAEFAFAKAKAARRMWVDIGQHYIRTNR
jgi:predicted nuclease of predicted toxin-antitoxin system